MAKRPQPRRRPRSALATRVRQAIALDAAQIVDRLSARQEELVSLFSRLRERGPLTETLHSVFSSIAFAELAALEPHEQRAVDAFYRVLGDLRWYVRYTEDMPLQLQARLGQLTRELSATHRLLSAVIGGARSAEAPAAEVRATPSTLKAPARSRRRR